MKGYDRFCVVTTAKPNTLIRLTNIACAPSSKGEAK